MPEQFVPVAEPIMTLHPLDNPVWSSLQSRHAALAQMSGGAGRYPATVAPFVAIDPEAIDAAQDLARLVAEGESLLIVGPAPSLSSGWSVEGPVPIAQMICDSRIAGGDGPEISELTDAQVADMLALTALVYPHYFRPRTIEMGHYLGIYDGSVLIAMAGERMGMDGYQEISAVCTHPDFTGRGHAQRLVAELNNAALDRGRVPFLHVSHENTRAKALYERLGYVHRTDVPLWSVRRLSNST
jgi:ribosomal protein S18 acetylase RimI-like enzyme